MSSVRTVRRRRRPAAIKNGSEVEHDTDPCARSSAPILSLRASPTLDRQHISAAYAGWACFCVHAGKGTSHHADSWDQAQTSRLRRACAERYPRCKSSSSVDQRFERERFLGDLQDLAHSLEQHAEFFGQFPRRRLAADLMQDTPARAHDLARGVYHAHRSLDTARPSLRRVMVSRVCRPRRASRPMSVFYLSSIWRKRH